MNLHARFLVPVFAIVLAMSAYAAPPEKLKLHTIFTDNMVLQRNKPIKVWGWAKPGQTVAVTLGEEKKEATSAEQTGGWETIFPAREASVDPLSLVVFAGEEKVELTNIVIGDVWVMFGQSNMAFGLGKTQQADLESAQADLPLLRYFGIQPNEQAELQTDIPISKIDNGGWTVSTPKTAGGFSAIGYVFGSRLQRALQIPIGIIKNARGGASLESLVPHHKFEDHPLAKRYAEYVAQQRAEFDPGKTVETMWQRQLARAKNKGVPEEKWPKKPTVDSLRSWNIPGMSPSDAASCYNGMFGAFKGYNIKGVLFHQGYNNAMGSNCRPKRYRVLMKLAVEGWREDFEDPQMPVAVIGFCAGGIPQTEDNFEVWTRSGGAAIRESQRLGVQDLGDPENTAFLPAYDVQIPGLHPHKKQEHGIRAARWALKMVYDQRVNWDTARLVSTDVKGDTIVLTFDKPVMPDDMSTIPRGFAIADKSGKYYLAHARFQLKKDVGIWNTANKSYDAKIVHVWSPLVKEPVAVCYAWATSPMGNLKVNGKHWLPLQSFRTDTWDWPESEDPAENTFDRDANKLLAKEAEERLAFRKVEEAKQAVTVLERLKTLGVMEEQPEK